MVGRPHTKALLLASLTTVGAACGDDSGGDGSGGSAGISDSGINLSGTTGDESEDETGELLLDLGNGSGSPDPTAGGDCPGNGGTDEDAYSIIWIANSPEGTVSKIDTRTRTELARYYTGPTQGADDPSRTSVNLSGDVAVTNRAGSVTKIASVEERCDDTNANGTIETSTGPADVLPWGQDECVLWHLPLPADGDNRHGPRPTAWDGGAGAMSGTCSAPDENLWIGYFDAATNAGELRRVDGNTGVILDSVSVPSWNSGITDYGPYGGAVDADGDLWAIGLFENLIEIDAETLEVRRWALPAGSDPYGIAIDARGRIWTAGWLGLINRFDPTTEQFLTIPTTDGRRMRGLQVDREGTVWIAANDPCGAISVDADAGTITNGNIQLPACVGPVGVSIDVDGSVWIPDREGNMAFKLDPSTLQAETVTGLVGPYTYSDMTGAGLGLVVNPPAG